MSRQLGLARSGLSGLSPRLSSQTQHKSTWSGSELWRADGQAIYGNWRRVETNLHRMRLDRSPFVPQNVSDYHCHKEEMDEIIVEEEEKRAIAEKNAKASAAAVAAQEYSEWIDEQAIEDRQAEFAKLSVWSKDWQPTVEHEESPWPSLEEYKEEGDERHTSGFGRFLPIPRVPGNPTVVWKQKSFQKQFPLDEVRPVAKKYGPIQLPYDYEVSEPTLDEDGNFVDDDDETGREAKPSNVIARGPRPSASQTALFHDLAASSLRVTEESRSLVDLGKHWTANSFEHQGMPRSVKSQPSLSAMNGPHRSALNAESTDFAYRGSPRASDAGSSAHPYRGFMVHGAGDRRPRSRSSIVSASSSSGSLYQSSMANMNPYSTLATPESEHGGENPGFQEDHGASGLLDLLTRPSSKSVSFVPSSVSSTESERRRRSTVSTAGQVGQRSMYGRSSFSRRDAIIEHVPKKYSKGFDDDGYEFFPPTPKAQEHSPTPERSANKPASSLGNRDVSPTPVSRTITATESGQVSPKTQTIEDSESGGSRNFQPRDPMEETIAYSLRELGL